MTEGPENNGPDESDPGEMAPFTPEGDDALAAEYVLGVLALPERMAFEARLRAERVLRYRVDRWQARLAPLDDDYAEVAAPDLMSEIEARLFGAPPRRSGWRFFSRALGGALAASVVLAIVLSQVPPPLTAPALRATLTAEAQALVFEASYDPESQTLRVARTAGPAAEDGRDYQLWLIGPSGVPVSLGVLTGTEATAEIEALAPGVTLAVSLEPLGGSPSDQPTGPVLVTGIVATL